MRLASSKCNFCGKTIYAGERSSSIWTDGTCFFFHERCFKCSSCGIRLTQTSGRSLEGKPYCLRDFKEVSMKPAYLKPQTTTKISTFHNTRPQPSVNNIPKLGPTTVNTKLSSKFGFVGVQHQAENTKENLRKHGFYVLDLKNPLSLDVYGRPRAGTLSKINHPKLLRKPREISSLHENTINDENPLLQLPPEIIAEISLHLSLQDVLNMELLCRRMTVLISDNKAVWMNQCSKRGYALDFLKNPVPQKVAWLDSSIKLQKRLFMLQLAYNDMVYITYSKIVFLARLSWNVPVSTLVEKLCSIIGIAIPAGFGFTCASTESIQRLDRGYKISHSVREILKKPDAVLHLNHPL